MIDGLIFVFLMVAIALILLVNYGSLHLANLSFDALDYQGTWNANTNTPTLADGTGTKGHYYVVSTGGSQDLGAGSLTYTAGDWVIHNGTAWQKADQSVTAAEISIADAGVLITATTVEGALQEHRPLINANSAMLTKAASGVPAALVLPEDTDNGSNTITMTAPASIASNRAITLPDADVNLTKVNYLTLAASGVPAALTLYEDTDNGSNYVTFAAPASLTSNRTITVPDADVTLSDIAANKLKTDTITLASASGSGSIYLSEDTDNGTNKVTIQPVAAITNDRTVSLPDADVDLAKVNYITLASSGVPAALYLYEDTDNGSSKVIFASPAALTSDRTITIPDADVDLSDVNLVDAMKLKTDTITVAASGVPAKLELPEDTDNGTNKVIIAAPAALTSDRTITLPDADVDLTDVNLVDAMKLKTDMITVAASGVPAKLELPEDTDNGSSKVIFAAPSALTSDRTITIPDADVNLGYLDQDVGNGAAPVLAATNFTGTFSGTTSGTHSGALSEDTDGQIHLDIVNGLAESGTWTASIASGLPKVARTAANNTTEYFDIEIPLPAKTTALKGRKITSYKVAYSCDGEDSGDDVQFHLCKRTFPADGSDFGAISTICGDDNADYDAAHNTAGERVDGTGAPEDHVATITNDATAYIGDGEAWFIRVVVTEADDATAALDIQLKGIQINYSETLA